jgi:hypothetical protein
MKSNSRLGVVIAMFGAWCSLAPGLVRAQSTQPAQAQTAAEAPATRMLRQSLTRESRNPTLAPAGQQKAPAEKRSWVSRHKVLAAVLIGVIPFVIWGALLGSSCSGGGC